MRQTHINTHNNTIEVEHREHIKTIKTQSNTTKYEDNFIWYIDTRTEQGRIFYANEYIGQATEKDDLADKDHLSSSVVCRRL